MVTTRSRRLVWVGVHPRTEIAPPDLGDRDVFVGNGAAVLLKDVEQHEQIDRAPVQDSIEVATTVATQFAQLATHLRAMGKGQRWVAGGQSIQQINFDCPEARGT